MSQRDHDFDTRARAMHGAALRQLSPQTLAQLRSARAQTQAETASRRWPWLAATAFSALLAVGLGVQLLPGTQAPASDPEQLAVQTPPATEATGSVTLLDENPDLYLWLASSEAQPLAME